MPEDLAEWLKRKAEREGKDEADVVVEMLRYCRRLERTLGGTPEAEVPAPQDLPDLPPEP